MAQYDVAVIGLGAMGSAALYHLARRGLRVVGIERFAPGHDRGSSHGETRIIRLGYFEHPSYVPLLRRTYELWRELELASAQQLLHITGIIEIGPTDGTVVPGTLRASRIHDLAHEVIGPEEIRRRYPAFSLPGDYVGVVQPEGGFVTPELAIATHLKLAQAAGAEVRSGKKVRGIDIQPERARVRIRAGWRSIEAKTAIVCAGPWMTSFFPQLPLRVTRQVMAWFEPRDPALFANGKLPVFLLESRHGVHYGFPPHGGTTIKVAKHHHRDEAVDPDSYDRTMSLADEALIRPMIADHMPAANGPLKAARTCLYTRTPDDDFIIDRLPDAPNVIVASPCSGHGFKFAPVIGEILADLACDGTTRHDISRFRLARFG